MAKQAFLHEPSLTYISPNGREWIVSQRGEHMGSIKKLKDGWRIDASYRDTSGRHFQACKLAAELLDERGLS